MGAGSRAAALRTRRDQLESRSVNEDAVVRDERQTQADRRRRDPTVAVVWLPAQRVSDSVASMTQIRADTERLIVRLNDGEGGDRALHPTAPQVAPSGAERSEAQLRDGLKRQQDRPPISSR